MKIISVFSLLLLLVGVTAFGEEYKLASGSSIQIGNNNISCQGTSKPQCRLYIQKQNNGSFHALAGDQFLGTFFFQDDALKHLKMVREAGVCN